MDLQRTDRHGIANLSLGKTRTLTLVADARAAPSSHTRVCMTGDVSKDVTVKITVGTATVAKVVAGSVKDCSSTATWAR